jgi:type VI secretion system protein ImpG
MPERLFKFYNDELEALRRLGGRFAAQYPKVAGRLRLSPDTVDDPHVARLVESFAFIAARLRLKLDDDLPELTETLLEFLYPHYLAPIPSLAIASIAPGNELTGPLTVPRGTAVESEAIEGDVCRFRTTQAVELWPIKVTRAGLSRQPFVAPVAKNLDAVACLHLVFECLDPRVTFTDLGLDRLRVYLRAPWRQAVDLYELLLNSCIGVALGDHAEDQAAVFLRPDVLTPAGLGDEDAALPQAPRGHPAYRLLSEFFAYPQKFMFLDLAGISAKALRRSGNALHVFFYLSRHSADLQRACTAETFALGCTPIINLFEQRAEPVVLTRAVSEYPVLPDARRHATREVYAVNEVSVTERTGQSRAAATLFGRLAEAGEASLHWQLRRRRLVEGDTGTDARIALVDAAAGPAAVTDGVLTIETTCLNRDLPARLPYGGGHPMLSIARGPAGVNGVQALTPFSPTLRLVGGDQLLWRLLSHLKLGHLSIADGTGGPETLREMMRLYDYRDAPESHALIDAITAVTQRRSTARVEDGGLARGLDVDIEMETRAIEPGQAFLFGQVLDRFFGLYVNLNSFSRLSLRLKGASRPLKTWAPRSGAKALL